MFWLEVPGFVAQKTAVKRPDSRWNYLQWRQTAVSPHAFTNTSSSWWQSAHKHHLNAPWHVEMVRMKHNNSTNVLFLQKRAKQLCHSGSRVVAASVFHTSCPPRSGSAQRTGVLLEAADVKWNRDPQFSGCGGLHPDADHMLIILTNLTYTLLLLL